MGFRFRKSVNIGKGFRLNFSKSGIGYSWGVKGARFTKTATGRNRTTFSLPGTGLSHVSESGGEKRQRKGRTPITRFVKGFILALLLIGIFRDYIFPSPPKPENTPQRPIEQTPHESAVHAHNEPIEMTGYLPRKTPAEIYSETSPYDMGVSIFATWHGFGAPGTNDTQVSEPIVIPRETVFQEPTGNTSDLSNSILPDMTFGIIDTINTHRVSLGLHELIFDPDLTAATDIRSTEMFYHDYFGHVRPNGDDWWSLLGERGISVYGAGEILAMTRFDPSVYYMPDADYWFRLWQDSPSHYEAIINPEYTHIGASVYSGTIGEEIVQIASTIFATY